MSTLSGDNEIVFTLKTCPVHSYSSRHVLDATVPRGCSFDYGVMIAVGLLRWAFSCQREEIRILLSARGISISTGEISVLSEQFLLRFYCVHMRHIARTVPVNHVLHLDGTGEAGREIVFMAKEGRTGMTIDAMSMPSESVEKIMPFLERVKSTAGVPIAIVRDMSETIRKAAATVFPGIIQLICHYHFVRDLGDAVFGRYSEFRAAVVGTKALAAIVAIEAPSDCVGIDGAERLWAALASEYILHPREAASRFPMTLPYVDVMDRCMEVGRLARKIIVWNMFNNRKVTEMMDLDSAVKRLCVRGSEALKLYHMLRRIRSWFERMREALGVSRELSSHSASDRPLDADSAAKKVNYTLKKIVAEGSSLSDELKRTSLIFENRIKTHYDELFAQVKGADGAPVDVVRHNGVEEIGHRWSRMRTRRRTGRSGTSREMAMYGALLAVFSNMWNTHYAAALSEMDFAGEMCSVTGREMAEARKLIRPNPRVPIVRNDGDRCTLLHEFIKIIEKYDTGMEGHMKRWVSAVKT